MFNEKDNNNVTSSGADLRKKKIEKLRQEKEKMRREKKTTLM